MVETVLAPAPAAVRPGAVSPGAVSPAAHLAQRFAAAEVTGARAVAIQEVPFLTMVGLRVVPGSVASERLEDQLGVRLPARCGEVGSAPGVSVLWLSPDEFLVVCDQEPAQATARLVQALAGAPGAVTDLSANRTTFELSGPSARAVLEKGCPLNLHPRALEVGSAYVTLIGSVPVILWLTADETYRILPRSSYADFLGRWLLDAMTEFTAPGIS